MGLLPGIAVHYLQAYLQTAVVRVKNRYELSSAVSLKLFQSKLLISQLDLAVGFKHISLNPPFMVFSVIQLSSST